MSKVLKSCFIFILILLSNLLHGQNVKKLDLERSQQLKYAQNLIKDLKDGYLIVRLQSFSTQIRYFEKKMSDPKTDQKELVRSEKELRSIISDRDTFNHILKIAMDSVYKFSQVRFIYDKDYSLTDTAGNNRNFLNDQMKADPSLGIAASKFLLMGYVNITTSSGQSKQYLKVLTPDFTEIPGQMQVPGNGVIFNLASDYNIFKFRTTMNKKIMKFNKKLEAFYTESLSQ